MDMSDLLAVPYRRHGRTLDGCDCYGWGRLVFQLHGRDLPEYSFEGTGEEIDEALELINAREVDEPQDLDLIYLASPETSEHIGVYLDRRVFQMTYQGVLSRPWRRILGQVKGIYRVED